ncbi:GIY-YIG nuclease family protein [Shewanella avicenniae]|uniref:GIY-YIG nuclease family protein n=1 Tax=Shewanella avicenniae TaxID=2814294 RepID=A0ABX7QQY1_9GAMM|nr:GIY-YIG nuclease family protein [Shewanella avicenniae]QSX33867.1 GIY-YIG nuclease family protein [Shewanella avicenniae]
MTEAVNTVEVADNNAGKSDSMASQSVSQTTQVWYLYMIRCRDGELYTGVTTDVARRVSEHQAGGAKAAKYLRGRAPLQLAYQECIGDKRTAHQREWQVKQLTRAQKLSLIAAQQANC